MTDSIRGMLDELMGKDRDLPPSMRTGRTVKFSDASVCKYQLAGLCPNMLFKNTKSDLGACQYEIHDDHIEWDSIQKQWEELGEHEKLRYGYERDLLRLLEQHIRDMDRKIAKAKERAEKESAPRELKPEDKERLAEIQVKVKEALEQSQRLGEEGDVDGAMMFSQQADAFRQQHDSLKKSFTQPERTMTVCEVCGVFINSTDNEQRRKDHLNGKQYIGWKKIRDKHKELVNRFDKLRQERENPREHDRVHGRERDRERDKDSERRDKSKRDRSRERRRDRSRDRSRERHSTVDHHRRRHRHSRSPRRHSPGHGREHRAVSQPDEYRRRRHEIHGHRY